MCVCVCVCVFVCVCVCQRTLTPALTAHLAVSQPHNRTSFWITTTQPHILLDHNHPHLAGSQPHNRTSCWITTTAHLVVSQPHNRSSCWITTTVHLDVPHILLYLTSCCIAHPAVSLILLYRSSCCITHLAVSHILLYCRPTTTALGQLQRPFKRPASSPCYFKTSNSPNSKI